MGGKTKTRLFAFLESDHVCILVGIVENAQDVTVGRLCEERLSAL
jgi:hypothetical protein